MVGFRRPGHKFLHTLHKLGMSCEHVLNLSRTRAPTGYTTMQDELGEDLCGS